MLYLKKLKGEYQSDGFISTWLSYGHETTLSNSIKKLKKPIRVGFSHSFRKKLWLVLSGGQKLIDGHVSIKDLYSIAVEDYFGLETTNIIVTTEKYQENSKKMHPFSLLKYINTAIDRLVHVLLNRHPEVTHCKILRSLANIFLKNMDYCESTVFACLSALLNSKNYEYFDQTCIQTTISAAVLCEICRHCLSDHTCGNKNFCWFELIAHCGRFSNDLLVYTDATSSLNADNHSKPREKSKITNKHSSKTKDQWKSVCLIYDWASLIFENLNATCLERIIDCYLIEGPIILFQLFIYTLSKLCSFKDIELSTDNLFDSLDTQQSRLNFVVKYISKFFKHFKIDSKILIEDIVKISINKKHMNKIYKRCQQLYKNGYLRTFQANDINAEKVYIDKSPSDIIEIKEWNYLFQYLPSKLQLMSLDLVFSTEIHGYNLKTMYSKLDYCDQSIILIKTKLHEIFGAYISQPFRNRFKCNKNGGKFFGTGQMFIFTIRPNFNVYHWVKCEEPKLKVSPSLSDMNYIPNNDLQKDYDKKHQNNILQSDNHHLTGSPSIKNIFLPFINKLFNKNKQKSSNIRRSSSESISHQVPTSVHMDNPIIDCQLEFTKPTCQSTSSNDLAVKSHDTISYETQDFFIAADERFLVIGGGNGYAIWIDENMLNGRSSKCDTFNNHPLTINADGDFICSSIEFFSFS